MLSLILYFLKPTWTIFCPSELFSKFCTALEWKFHLCSFYKFTHTKWKKEKKRKEKFLNSLWNVGALVFFGGKDVNLGHLAKDRGRENLKSEWVSEPAS